MTFECAVDDDIADARGDCSVPWSEQGGDFAREQTDEVAHTNATTGEVAFDVTADVREGAAGWLVKKVDESAGGGVRYVSREGALERADPDLGPRLLLEY